MPQDFQCSVTNSHKESEHGNCIKLEMYGETKVNP